MRKALATTACAVLLLWASGALAGPVSEEARARAEDAFVQGRFEDMDAAVGAGTTPADVELLALRDLWWRAGGPEAGRPWPADDGTLSSRRVRWCREAAASTTRTPPSPYPVPSLPPSAERRSDPYARATALVLERVRREGLGAAGLPEDSPAARLKDPAIDAFLAWYGRRAWKGPAPDDLTDADRAEEARIAAGLARVRARDRWIALLAAAALLAMGGLAWARLGPPRPTGVEAPARPTDPSE